MKLAVGLQSNTDIIDDLNAQTSACDISGLQLHAVRICCL